MARIEHLTLNDRAYEEIKKGLIGGAFTPGQPLVIRALAETYGVSATPVREALQRLVAERLLIMLPNRSIVAPELTAAKFEELARIRSALEGMAADRAAGRMKKSQTARLAALVEEMDEAISDDDNGAYVRLNREFHFAVYEQADSPHLVHMIQELWSQVGPYFTRLFQDEAFLPKANKHHRAIVEALAAGDGETARLSIIADINDAAASLLPRLREEGDSCADGAAVC